MGEPSGWAVAHLEIWKIFFTYSFSERSDEKKTGSWESTRQFVSSSIDSSSGPASSGPAPVGLQGCAACAPASPRRRAADGLPSSPRGLARSPSSPSATRAESPVAGLSLHLQHASDQTRTQRAADGLPSRPRPLAVVGGSAPRPIRLDAAARPEPSRRRPAFPPPLHLHSSTPPVLQHASDCRTDRAGGSKQLYNRLWRGTRGIDRLRHFSRNMKQRQRSFC